MYFEDIIIFALQNYWDQRDYKHWFNLYTARRYHFLCFHNLIIVLFRIHEFIHGNSSWCFHNAYSEKLQHFKFSSPVEALDQFQPNLALSWKLGWAILIACHPSSIRGSVNFTHFHLLLQSLRWLIGRIWRQ